MRKLIFLIAITGFISANAQDRVFTYTYQSGVLNKGQKELEVWTTMSNGRENYYQSLNHRMEFELGLGGKLQTAFYLNSGYSKGVEDAAGVKTLMKDTEYSFSNEWKLKLSDPAADFIGSALYFEYSLAPAETELEGKIILDKQTGKFVHAFNLVGEYETMKEFVQSGPDLITEKHNETVIELNYGLSYKLKENFSVGFEVMNANQIDGSEWENSVLFAGPGFSWKTDSFWINFTCLPQITNLKGGGYELEEHEKIETRLLFSYEF